MVMVVLPPPRLSFRRLNDGRPCKCRSGVQWGFIYSPPPFRGNKGLWMRSGAPALVLHQLRVAVGLIITHIISHYPQSATAPETGRELGFGTGGRGVTGDGERGGGGCARIGVMDGATCRLHARLYTDDDIDRAGGPLLHLWCLSLSFFWCFSLVSYFYSPYSLFTFPYPQCTVVSPDLAVIRIPVCLSPFSMFVLCNGLSDFTVSLSLSLLVYVFWARPRCKWHKKVIKVACWHHHN